MALSSTPRRRLRTYVIGFLLPVTLLPLALLTFFLQLLVGNAVEAEFQRRADPELQAFSRNLERAERVLRQQLFHLGRSGDFKVAVLARRAPLIEREVKTAYTGTLWEQVRVYSFKGQLLYQMRREGDADVLKAWETLFPPPKSGALAAAPFAQNEEREPASKKLATVSDLFVAPQGRFVNGQARQLHPDFATFLRVEDLWSLRERAADGENGVQLVAYKAVFDSDGRIAGFVEARARLEARKLALLARAQSVELALFSPSRALLAASNPLARAKLAVREPTGGTTASSRVIELSAGNPVEYFYMPLLNEGSEAVAWVAVGLSKADMLHLRQRVLGWALLLGLLFSIGVLLITLSFSKKITKPVSDLVQATEAIKAGEWVQPVEDSSRTELGLLVQRFNEMAQSVQVTKRALEDKLKELNAANDAIRDTQDQLVHSAKMSSLGQLVAGVAHELNNPIAFIYSNMCQMKTYLKNLDELDARLHELEKRLPESEGKQLRAALQSAEWEDLRKDMQEMVPSCLEGSVRIKDIVLGLRNFSRIDKGDVVDADINAALENTAKILSSQFKNRIELHWQLESEARVDCNVAQLGQVFMNLLANAAQAIEGKGNIWIATRWEGDWLRISIRDDGKGIPSANLQRIFDPFFTTKKVGEGTGLGLSIVYGIIERHRGRIHVSSRVPPDPQHGSEFTLHLPRHSTDSATDSSRRAS